MKQASSMIYDYFVTTIFNFFQLTENKLSESKA